MKPGKRLPLKIWVVVLLAGVGAVLALNGQWGDLLGRSNPRDAFLDAVAGDFKKDPRLTVVRVDHAAGQIVIQVKSTGKTLTLTVTSVEAKTLPSGEAGEAWSFDWKDQAGKVISLGHLTGTRAKTMHVDVPDPK